ISCGVGGTGKMPIPQAKSISCGVGGTGKMPIPQAKSISCGVGVGRARCPSHKQNQSLVGWASRPQDAHPTSKINLLWGGRPARPGHWCKM
ncbi:hypothetical protein, partial [Microseira wollei]|uniref:hypothetical protein n=1 Tax=Microseira wollei TaxID=467598 RepID=UPI001CFC56C1